MIILIKNNRVKYIFTLQQFSYSDEENENVFVPKLTIMQQKQI